jgi:membrane protease YdiL (CAAX protease family)
MNERGRTIRNVVIFVLGSYGLSAAGGILMAGGNDLGGVVFVVGPILMAVLVRALGGAGWADAGLGLRLKAGWGWYVFSLLAYPVSFVIVILIGMALGITRLNGPPAALVSPLVAGIAANLIPRTLFAMCEEWGWRGYLEPRLESLGMAALPRHLLVGLIWGPWHLPLILATAYTDLPLALFLPLFLIGLLVAAVVYGEVRAASGTVWTAVLMHGAANVLAFAIIDHDLIAFGNKALAYIAPESVIVIVLWALAGWWLLRRSGAGAE